MGGDLGMGVARRSIPSVIEKQNTKIYIKHGILTEPSIFSVCVHVKLVCYMKPAEQLKNQSRLFCTKRRPLRGMKHYVDKSTNVTC